MLKKFATGHANTGNGRGGPAVFLRTAMALVKTCASEQGKARSSASAARRSMTACVIPASGATEQQVSLGQAAREVGPRWQLYSAAYVNSLRGCHQNAGN